MIVPRTYLRLQLECHCLVLDKGKGFPNKSSAQIGDGMSGVHLYFDIRQNCDGRVVSLSPLLPFTAWKFLRNLPLDGGCSTRILNSNRIASLEIFQLPSTHIATARLVKCDVGFCISVARESTLEFCASHFHQHNLGTCVSRLGVCARTPFVRV
jgi:hypothetical protein